ncbi:MAG: NAD-glutamate dehydrogenase [Deltaproteobacteria bacterium]|nr:NAD-glutamate dehydrogenase [Deltaproteobacteria bacterium]
MSETPTAPEALVQALTESTRVTAETVVPWFLETMPGTYFHDTPPDTVQAHLRAICAARASGLPLSLTLISENRDEWTFIRETNRTGLLADLIRRLPRDRVLRSAKIHGAKDGRLALDSFSFRPAERFDPSSPDLVARRETVVKEAAAILGDRSPESIAEHLARCTTEYVLTVTAYRVAANLRLYEAVSGSDDVRVDVEPFAEDPTLRRVAIAAGNAAPRDLFERVADALSTEKVDIRRAHLESMDDGANGFVTVISLVVRPPEVWALDGPEWRRTTTALSRLRWLDARVLEVARNEAALSFEQAELLVALADLSHQWLSAENPYLYTRNRVLKLALQAGAPSHAIVRALQARFAEDGDPKAFLERLTAILAETHEAAGPREVRAVVRTMAEIAGAILGTNLGRPDRYALALSLDPRTLQRAEETRPLPHAVVFGHGRDFAAFHVRFRNIARGGLRVVRTASAEGHARECDRLYAEAFGLAHAQQLKNKDIPEGGAKGVILAAPGASVERVVKAFGDALLDVTLAASSEERLYLGPDENITDELIEWLVDRARRRGHPVPDAFMSSKPGAGINHKRYGVTSEGVVVFLEEALRAIGVDPRSQSFSVKLTGGPDGDVAGNALRILHREFGGHVRVVGIADGSGSAEDPDGLHIEELLRLVKASAPIANFDATRLGPKGRVLGLDTPEGLLARNTLHSRVAADAFLPCGGRPATIHAENWRDFLKADGSPSSRLIVEGANLFVTDDARRELATRAGVVVVKDSSANKCGVITSSFEIAASMLLDERGFLAIKEAFVAEVLERLRALARQEAALLFRLHRRHPERPLSEASVRVSAAINRATDAVVAALATSSERDRDGTRGLVLEHLPPSLVAAAGPDLLARLPTAYLDRVVASSLAADLVYREGDAFFDGLGDDAIGRLALRYLQESRRVRALIEEVEASDLPNREAIAALLDRGGRRAAVEAGA